MEAIQLPQWIWVKITKNSKLLQDIIKEVNSLRSVSIDGTDFSIELVLGADLKFLANNVEIQSANATYCVWWSVQLLKGTIQVYSGLS